MGICGKWSSWDAQRSGSKQPTQWPGRHTVPRVLCAGSSLSGVLCRAQSLTFKPWLVCSFCSGVSPDLLFQMAPFTTPLPTEPTAPGDYAYCLSSLRAGELQEGRDLLICLAPRIVPAPMPIIITTLPHLLYLCLCIYVCNSFHKAIVKLGKACTSLNKYITTPRNSTDVLSSI